MATRQRLGELLLNAGLIDEQELSRALRMQVGGNRRLGRILLQMKCIDSDQLLEVLSQQLNLPIINIKDCKEPDAGNIIPRYLCKKYEVFPLSTENHNILKLAMVDPSDTTAIMDIENFSGLAVEPCLARQEDINKSINKYIPFSPKDIFNPQNYTSYAKTASALALILILIVGGFTYRFYTQTKYGSITRTADSVIFKNHDLMVGFDQSGKATLLGRGAHATGYFSISFNSPEALATFLDHKKDKLSSSQYEWAKWVVSNNP